LYGVWVDSQRGGNAPTPADVLGATSSSGVASVQRPRGHPTSCDCFDLPRAQTRSFWGTHAPLRPRERRNHCVDQSDPLDCRNWRATRTIGSRIPGRPYCILYFRGVGLASSTETYSCAVVALSCQ